MAVAQASAVSVKEYIKSFGKSSNIILDDGNQKISKRRCWHCFLNSGQSCDTPTKMLVSEKIMIRRLRLQSKLLIARLLEI